MSLDADGADHLVALAEQAQVIADQYADLAEANGRELVSLRKRARSNRRMIWAVALSVALDLVLSAVLVVLSLHSASNTHRLNALTARLDTSQTTTRRNSLCPLYTLLKSGETRAARAAAPDKAAYDHAVMVIRDGYTALGCAEFVSSPPVAGPTAG